jgi:hypothetical protein
MKHVELVNCESLGIFQLDITLLMVDRGTRLCQSLYEGSALSLSSLKTFLVLV